MGRIRRIIDHPSKYLSPVYLLNTVICGRLFPLWMKIAPLVKSDKLYIRIFYRLGMGRKLNLENPETYTEKLHWLKLHNTDPLFSRMVDKYSAREVVAQTVGAQHLVPLLGVWDKFEEIGFNSLPDEFVLKTTHDSGTVVICRDKSALDFTSLKKTLTKALRRNYFSKSREYPYKNTKPRIIAEKYLNPITSFGITDYKFFCFNGHVRFLLVITTDQGRKFNSWLDLGFEPLPFNTGFPTPKRHPDKPENFEEMVSIAEKLSKDLAHVRIDLYNLDGQVYFGEFTFHHSGGIIGFNPPEWDRKLGELIIMPNSSTE